MPSKQYTSYLQRINEEPISIKQYFPHNSSTLLSFTPNDEQIFLKSPKLQIVMGDFCAICFISLIHSVCIKFSTIVLIISFIV